MEPAVIITTIFSPNAVMQEIAAQCNARNRQFIIAGDSKSPADFQIEGATYLDLSSQRTMGAYGRACPERSYTRKNLAYLHAIRSGAPWLVETDDDNMPREDFWKEPAPTVSGRMVGRRGWVNAYRYFAERFIYPRGYPIDLALPDWTTACEVLENGTAHSPIQQALADDNPDVDAIYRMLHPLPFSFSKQDPLLFGAGSWCPFNSQNTLWFPEVYPLLYLPATCSFRMTDIWRSFIAQRLLWTCGWQLSFHSATVYQDRNEHRLLSDFEEEIPGYLGNQTLVQTLDLLSLNSGPEHLAGNLETCYAALIAKGFFKPEEETLLKAWLEDLPKPASSLSKLTQ